MSIKEKLPLLNSERKTVRLVGYFVYAVVLLSVLGSMGGDDRPSTATTTAEGQELEPEQATAAEPAKEKIVIDEEPTKYDREAALKAAKAAEKEREEAEAKEVNEVASSGVLDVVAVKSLLPRDEKDAKITVGGGVVTITRKLKDNLTPRMTLGGARIDSIDIFKALFKDDRVRTVAVISQTQFVDNYGQTSTGTATKYQMTRATFDKVNWDNIPFENLDKIVDDIFIHPALRG